ncbi:acetyltransferase [Rhizobium sp. NPDC090279]|uniref:acetyltransferase n=1 Tax=Rhizobium sp. NPDC090279 TaxID=3364499 RepID=UPI00383AC43A
MIQRKPQEAYSEFCPFFILKRYLPTDPMRTASVDDRPPSARSLRPDGATIRMISRSMFHTSGTLAEPCQRRVWLQTPRLPQPLRGCVETLNSHTEFSNKRLSYRDMFLLRQARPDDVARNYEIWRTSVEATHDFLAASDREAIARMVEEDYLPNAEFTVAVDDDDLPHGFMGVTGNHIDSLFIHAESRGKGLGRLLLESFRTGKDVVTVDVNEQNAGAVGFYRRLGFAVTGRAEVDDQGRHYPILHLQWQQPAMP